MRNILISQRSDYFPEYDEYRDSLDQRFARLLGDKMHLVPLSNYQKKIAHFCKSADISGVILSGGNSVDSTETNFAAHRDQAERAALAYAFQHQLPVIGICHGFQLINCYLNGNVRKIPGHVKTAHVVVIDQKTYEVNSFHQAGIIPSELAQDLIALGTAPDQSVELALHKTLPWLGLMWHPERKINQQALWLDLIADILVNKFTPSTQNIISYLETHYVA